MTEREGYDCGQCGGQCDLCKEAERIDRCSVEGEDLFLPRWMYFLLLAGACTVILLAGCLL